MATCQGEWKATGRDGRLTGGATTKIAPHTPSLEDVRLRRIVPRREGIVKKSIDDLTTIRSGAILRAMSHRLFKDRIYHEFARIGQALANEKRLEILDLLAQSPRHVDALAAETEQSVANISQHLQVLRAARLLNSDRAGTRVIYRLADPVVLSMWLAVRNVAETRLAEVGEVTREFMGSRDEALITRAELEAKLARNEVFLIDVRPPIEYASGHLPGAVRMPIEELPERLHEIPRDRTVVAYCRGEYCLFADEAVALLRDHGIAAARLEGGWPEWLTDGREVATNGDRS